VAPLSRCLRASVTGYGEQGVIGQRESLYPGFLSQSPASYSPTLSAFDATHYPNYELAEYNGLLAGLVELQTGWDPFAKATRGEVASMLWELYSRVSDSL
jgi:hypothetical protein